MATIPPCPGVFALNTPGTIWWKRVHGTAPGVAGDAPRDAGRVHDWHVASFVMEQARCLPVNGAGLPGAPEARGVGTTLDAGSRRPLAIDVVCGLLAAAGGGDVAPLPTLVGTMRQGGEPDASMVSGR
jgi:hypothetical protein